MFNPFIYCVLPREILVGFTANKVALGEAFYLNPSAVPCQYHATAGPYSLMHHLGAGQWGQLAAAVPQTQRIIPSKQQIQCFHCKISSGPKNV